MDFLRDYKKGGNHPGILAICSTAIGLFFAGYFLLPAFASPPTSPFTPGETLNPSCAPGDTNCTVYNPLSTTINSSTNINIGTSTLNFGNSLIILNGNAQTLTLASTTLGSATSTNFFSTGLTFTSASGTSVTSTNLSVSGALSLPSNSVLDAMISSASSWNAKLSQALASSTYLTFSYPALATSSFLAITASTSLAYLNLDYPSLATSSFLGVGYSSLATSTFLSQSYTALATSTFLAISASTSLAYLGLDYPALATSSFLGVGYPALATSSFLYIGFQALASSTYLATSYPALATSSFLGVGYTALASSTFLAISASTTLAYLGLDYPSLATSTFLNQSYTALATSSFLGVGYPSLATTTFLSLTGGTLTGGLIFTTASGTSATSTNLAITSLIDCNASNEALQTGANGQVSCGTISAGGGSSSGINTSTINYLAYYLTATTVTGTSFAQFSASGLTFTNATSTNLYISGLVNAAGTTTLASSAGRVSIGTSTLDAKLVVQGNTFATSSNSFHIYNSTSTLIMKVRDSGDISFANDGLYYEASTTVSYLNALETGPLNFDDDAGMVSWVDMTVSSTAAGTPMSYTASIDDNPMLMIYAESNGTGGIQNQTISINTSTTSTYKLYIDAGGSANAGLGVNGFIRSTGFIAGTTTLDLAETFPLRPGCEQNNSCPNAGDVVCSATVGAEIASTFVIEKCSMVSSDEIIGVISANPGFVLGGYEPNDAIKGAELGLFPSSFKPVAMAGRVPVNVSTANGPILHGDLLTSSNIPGVAVKALEPGRVIGVALQSFEGGAGQPPSATAEGVGGGSSGTITMFVNPHWSPGSPTYQEGVGGVAGNAATMPDFSLQMVLDKFTLAIKNSLRKLGLLIEGGVAKVNKLFTNELCIGNTCVNEQQLQDLLQKNQISAIQAPMPTTPPVIPSFAEESLSPSTTPALNAEINSSTIDTAATTTIN